MAETIKKTRSPASTEGAGEDGAVCSAAGGAKSAPTAPSGKPLLTIPQQVEHLRSKGVTFGLVGETEAARMLAEEAPYFSLACYRHLFERRVGGPRDGQYVSLDFGHLAALHAVDRALRAALLQASLDVEQAARARLNARMTEARGPDGAPEDGYAVVGDFLADQGPTYGASIRAEVERLADDEYSGAVARKYRDRMPAWVFLELASFGAMCRFYRFCSDRWGDRAMRAESFSLRDVKKVRNACAHGTAIVNGIAGKRPASSQIPAEVSVALTRAGVPHRVRTSQLANCRMRQIASALLARSALVAQKPAPLMPELFAAIDAAVRVLPKDGKISSALEFVKTLTLAFGLL